MRDISAVRTIVDLDEDVLKVARELARKQGRSLSQVVSSLIEKEALPAKSSGERNGIPLFPISKNARPVTSEIVAQLLEDEP
jgi:hypothetical protein